MSKHEEQIVAAAKGKVDEEIRAAAFAKPRGATTMAVGGGVISTEIGAAKVRKQGAGAAEAGLEIGNPGAIAVTPASLVTMKVKVSFTGQIKEVTDVLSVVPLGEIDSLTVKRMGMAGVMEINAGSGSLKLEGKVDDMRKVEEAFAAAKG